MKVTLKSLESVVSTLANPSKMPGYAWGISAKKCKRGSKLRKVEGTVCHVCYALKGRCAMPQTQAAYDRRLTAFNLTERDQWCETMAALIARRTDPEDPYFRVFESGDLQSREMLVRWMLVATLLPHIHFWLVTRERGILSKVDPKLKPANLLIRTSADMIDGLPPAGYPHTSVVLSKMPKAEWQELVDQNDNRFWHCPAPLQDNKCGSCRACWDEDVEVVAYMHH